MPLQLFKRIKWNLISEMKTASPRMPSPLTAGITRLACYLQMLSYHFCYLPIIMILWYWNILEYLNLCPKQLASQGWLAMLWLVTKECSWQSVAVSNFITCGQLDSDAWVFVESPSRHARDKFSCWLMLNIPVLGLGWYGWLQWRKTIKRARKTYKSPCLHLSVNWSFEVQIQIYTALVPLGWVQLLTSLNHHFSQKSRIHPCHVSCTAGNPEWRKLSACRSLHTCHLPNPL